MGYLLLSFMYLGEREEDTDKKVVYKITYGVSFAPEYLRRIDIVTFEGQTWVLVLLS